MQLGLKIFVGFECPVDESDRLIGELRIADRILGHSPRERRHRVNKQTGYRDIRVPPAITIRCWRAPRLHHATPRLIQWTVLLVVAIRKYRARDRAEPAEVRQGLIRFDRCHQVVNLNQCRGQLAVTTPGGRGVMTVGRALGKAVWVKGRIYPACFVRVVVLEIA